MDEGPLYYKSIPDLPSTSGPTTSGDAIANRSLTRNNPLRLLNPFRLKHGAAIWVCSQYPIVLLQFETLQIAANIIECSSPVCIQSDGTTWLVPKCPLQKAFVKGWNGSNIPGELRANVLKHALFVELGTSRHETKLDLLKHYRRLPMNSKRLVDEAFYSINEIQVETNSRIDDLTCRFILPHRSVRSWIRKLHFTFDAIPSEYRALQSVARKELGLSNLTYVTVRVFDWGYRITNPCGTMRKHKNQARRELEAWLPGTANFECDGELVFPESYEELAMMPTLNRTMMALQDYMREKIEFNQATQGTAGATDI